MKYKGYEAVITYEEDVNAFHGRVIDIRDIISFEGASVEELEREFQASMDYYLAMCTERGEEPDKPFSGKVHLRMPPKIHRAASTAAQAEGKSINAWLVETIERAVH